MNPRDPVRLQHLPDALNSAARFVQGRERGDLDAVSPRSWPPMWRGIRA